MRGMAFGPIGLLCFAVAALAANGAESRSPGAQGEVNVFLGTRGEGHTTPAATCPLGLVQPGPDTGDGSGVVRNASGFNLDDPVIYGFSQTHLSGTGCLSLGDIRLFPYAGEHAAVEFGSAYDRRTQRGEPGYYSVVLDEGRVAAEMTCTKRVAVHRYVWPKESADKRLLVDFQWGVVYADHASDHIRSCDIRRTEDGFEGEYAANCWAERDVHFALAFDRKPASVRLLPPRRPEDRAPRYEVTFGEGGGTVQVKVAISAFSVDGARRNLAEAPHWDFDRYRREAAAQWRPYLESMDVATDDPAKRTVFRTCLYHLFFQPNDISDLGDRPFYSTLSTWDTFRAAHPLYTIVSPWLVDGFVNSFLRHYLVTGYLPVWQLWRFDTQCMIANHAVPVAVDACLKGFRGFDPEALMDAVNGTLRVRHTNRKREFWDVYDTYGFFPREQGFTETASRTLEQSYDDWCAMRLAETLGRRRDAAFYLRRSYAYTNVIDTATRFARGCDAAGNFREPFDPCQVKPWKDPTEDYTEGNAWQYTWHVLQRPEHLVELFGGKTQFADHLSTFFSQPRGEYAGSVVEAMGGIIGQYAHGNEPSHHAIYLFQYADRSDLTEKYVAKVCDEFYGAGPDGLCGNDDCGQTSAWYLFSVAGFYPVNPCGGDYVIGAPQFEEVSFRVGDGKVFRVVARNFGGRNRHVAAVRLNGKPLDGFILKHADVMKGGTLEFEMTDRAERSWRRSSGATAKEPEYAAIERAIGVARRECEERAAALSDRVSVLDFRNLVETRGGTNIWTKAIQKALDEHEVVVIPASGSPYYVDAPLVVPSNRRLEASGARIRLADGVRTVLLRNANVKDGTLAPVPDGTRDDNIAIVGGSWEDWHAARAGYGASGTFHADRRGEKGDFYGVSTLFLFENCNHVAVRDATFANCAGFAVQIGGGDAIVFDRIRFDDCHADGLHLNGNLTRVHCRDIRGKVGDDLVAMNAYDWHNSSIDFGPQRFVLCEDLELVLKDGKGYPAIRIQPAKYRYADGSVVDCAISDVIFRRVRGIRTFKMYLQTPQYVIGRNDRERAEVGSGGNFFFENLDIDLTGPIDNLGPYAGSDPLRGHFAAFELGANLTSLTIRDSDVAFHADRWPQTHLVTVGPKSAPYVTKRGNRMEIFDPYVSCTVGTVRVENVRIRGAAPTNLVHAVEFEDVNGDGDSTGRGRIGKVSIGRYGTEGAKKRLSL